MLEYNEAEAMRPAAKDTAYSLFAAALTQPFRAIRIERESFTIQKTWPL
jgi:hypothetical protein